MTNVFDEIAGLLDPALIDAETLAFNKQIEDAMNAAPPRWEMPIEVERNLRRGGGVVPDAKAAHAETRTISGPAGEIPIRILRPSQTAKGIYLHFHGGGYCLGSADGQDDLLSNIVADTGCAVVSVDYRLAPENPYPAAAEDGEAVARWLLETSQQEFGVDKIVVGGESAGANLSLTVLLRLKGQQGFHKFVGVNLVYGAFDMRLTPGARAWGERRLVLNTPTYICHLDRYLQNADRSDPGVSPFFADLSGLPAALFTVGTLDLCLEDNLFMSMRWIAARNRGNLALYPGGIHGFTLFGTELGNSARRRCNAFISECIADDKNG